jgi:hypothetical protein
MDERMILSRINVTGDFRFLKQPQAHAAQPSFSSTAPPRAFNTSLNAQVH